MNQGADDVVNKRYRQAMMQRTMSGMDRNTKIEELSRKAIQGGQLDPQAYSELASYDPERAKALREAVNGPQTNWQMGRIGDGQGGEIDVLFDPREPSKIRTIDGQPIGGAPQQSAPPQGGLLGVSPGMGTPNIGLLQPEQLQAEYTQLASAYPGTQISSRLRTPERNKAVGGVANSQHLRGTAADFVVPATARPQFIADVRKRGLEAIDEGDHVHVELPPRAAPGSRLSAVPAGLGIGRRPAKSTQEKERYRNMSAAEIKALGLPEGTVAQEGPTGQVQIVNKPRDLPAGGQVIENEDGTTTYIPAGKTSVDEKKAAGFYERMIQATKELKEVADSGYTQGRRDYYTAGKEYANPLATPQGQRLKQAQNNWIRANLRKESGAVIGPEEMEEERRTYFQIPGDSPEVLKQKERARAVTELAMRQSAGGALPPTGARGAPSASPAASSGWSIQRVK